jgi:asparagine synthase (glutamine-hydrolysing)
MGSLAVIAPRTGAPDVAAAKRMLRAASRRGHDLDIRIHGQAAFGVSNDFAFPDAWLAHDNSILAGFTGTLDNRLELNAQLEREGFPVHGEDPASTLLALFHASGRPTPERLRGSFAAALSDGTGVWCFRDHLGFRSLFFRNDARAFVAASEAKQVVAGAGILREPDLEAIERGFWDSVEERTTALKGVERFPRASLCRVEAGDASFERYWDPGALLETSRLTVDDACQRLSALLDQAISRSITGNDALMLSGGIDSPAIAAFGAPRHLERGGRPLQALSRLYPDYPTVDEGRYIRLVSDGLDLDLSTYTSNVSALDRVSYWVDVLDGPSNVILVPDLAESYMRARDLGARTVMTGELAEFVFTQRQHLIGHLVLRGRVTPTVRWLRDSRARGREWRRIGRDVATSLAPAALATAYTSRRNRDRRVATWLDRRGSRHRYDLAIPARRRWEHFQLLPFESPVVSYEAADLCAAVCGVHERKPLGDVDLWEFLLSLRAETKFPDSTWKSLLRRTLRGRLPDELLDRRDKTAFDEQVLANIDYAGLQRCITPRSFRIGGVDYDLLASRLERRNLGVFEVIWAYDVARAHAFVDLWA